MKKPILIDALHINMGGALMILNHLVDRLVARKISFVLLKDDRCPKLRSEDAVPQIEVLSCNENVRKRYYKSRHDCFQTILCLGNVPPPIKLDIKVYTYIHNVSLLKIPDDYPLSYKVKGYLKRWYIRQLASNTDGWIVQTNNTCDLVRRFLPVKQKEVLEYPFYYIPETFRTGRIEKRQDYVFVGEYTNAKGHEYLMEAWRILSEKGFTGKLHMTVSDTRICKLISDMQKDGVNIVNHGFIDFHQIAQLYNCSKAIVYPSLNESLGLGIVEAIEAGCDVIGCDLPYTKSVCTPSEYFCPRSAESIAEAVLRYEQGKSPATRLLISDKADELIDFLSDKGI